MDISIGGYIFTQTALLVMCYGFKIMMPKWVLWFPSIIIGIILSIVLLIFIIYVIKESIWW